MPHCRLFKAARAHSPVEEDGAAVLRGALRGAHDAARLGDQRRAGAAAGDPLVGAAAAACDPRRAHQRVELAAGGHGALLVRHEPRAHLDADAGGDPEQGAAGDPAHGAAVGRVHGGDAGGPGPGARRERRRPRLRLQAEHHVGKDVGVRCVRFLTSPDL